MLILETRRKLNIEIKSDWSGWKNNKLNANQYQLMEIIEKSIIEVDYCFKSAWENCYKWSRKLIFRDMKLMPFWPSVLDAVDWFCKWQKLNAEKINRDNKIEYFFASTLLDVHGLFQ